jgi:hypothetical protein
VPFTFVPGALADANQVNANYAAIIACLLNAAGAGANNDITALNALTTPITPAQGGSLNYLGGTSTGTNTVAVTTTQPLSGFALTRGYSVLFTALNTNTGATTLNVNTLGAINLFRTSPSGPQALTGGEIIAGDLVWAVYDGTQFQLINSGAQYGGFGPLVSLTSATTTDLGTVPTHNVNITGTTTITAFGSTASTTFPVYNLTFSGALLLTYNATSLILPSTASITTAANDTATALYLGSGNWQIMDYRRANGTSVVSPTPLCGFSGLYVHNDSSQSTITWIWDSSVLVNATGNVPVFSTGKTGTVNITTGTSGTSTAGGMDGTAPAINSFVYLYAIYNGTAWNVVGSNVVPASFTTRPTGYDWVCYMGAIKVDSSVHLYGTILRGAEGQYVVGGPGNTVLPSIANGINGSANCTTASPTPTLFTVRGSAGAGVWIPANATKGFYVVNTNFANGGAGTVWLAPNASYGGGIGAAFVSPPPITVQAASTAAMGSMMFEANTIAYCANNAQGQAQVLGWKDQVNAN